MLGIANVEVYTINIVDPNVDGESRILLSSPRGLSVPLVARDRAFGN